MVHAVQVVLGRAAQFWEAEGPIGPGAKGYSATPPPLFPFPGSDVVGIGLGDGH